MRGQSREGVLRRQRWLLVLVPLVAIFAVACGSTASSSAGGGGQGGTSAAGTGGQGGAPGAVTGGNKQAFVSYDEITGNAGVAAADAACQKDADVWFSGRHFRAWISTSTESALARVGSGPWFLGTDRLGTTTELAANALGTSFNRTATGSAFATGEYVWTGTASGGLAATDTCADWTSADRSMKGEIGQINYSNEKWTASLAETCDHGGHLYCLEQ